MCRVYTRVTSENGISRFNVRGNNAHMRKVAVLAVAVLACSLGARAGTVSALCSPFTFPFSGGAGAGTLSCPGFATLGVVGAIDISGVALSLYADYEAGSPLTVNKVTATFDTTPGTTGLNSGISWALGNTTTMSVTGGFSSAGSLPASPNPDAASSAAFGTPTSLAQWTAFSIGISSVLNSGSVTTSSAGATITYVYDVAQAIPEPGSTALFGGGLLAVLLFGRKKPARR